MSEPTSVIALKIVSGVLAAIVILFVMAFAGKIIFFIALVLVLIGLGVWLYFVLRPKKKDTSVVKPEVVQIATRLGLKYNTSDPAIQKLFSATNGVLDAAQKEICAAVMANFKEMVDGFNGSLEGKDIPCSDGRNEYAEFKKDPSYLEMPQSMQKAFDDFFAALMEAVCDKTTDKVNEQKLKDFVTAVAHAVCG